MIAQCFLLLEANRRSLTPQPRPIRMLTGRLRMASIQLLPDSVASARSTALVRAVEVARAADLLLRFLALQARNLRLLTTSRLDRCTEHRPTIDHRSLPCQTCLLPEERREDGIRLVPLASLA